MDWAVEALKQVPALAVLAWIVRTFITHLERRDELQREAIECIRHNTEVLGAVKDALRHSTR